MGHRWSVLHITDLHYHDDNANFLDDNKDQTLSKYREGIFPHLQSMVRSLADCGRRFDLVAVCGDLTTRGSRDGFDSFARELLPELGRLVRSRSAICLVPGNHDVKWGLEASNPARKFKDFRALVHHAEVTSCYFPDGNSKDLRFSGPPSSPIFTDRENKILGLCINSSLRCGERNSVLQRDISAALREERVASSTAKDVIARVDKHLVRDVAEATAPQLQCLKQRLNEIRNDLGDEWPSFLKVGMLHHHLVHFGDQVTEHKAYELMNDSNKLLNLLVDFDFDLVLTGHKHQHYVEKHQSEDREVLLVGGPTVGGHRASDSYRGFRIIEVESQHRGKDFDIADISCEGRASDLRHHIEHSPRTRKRLFCGRSPKIAFEMRAEQVGFSYRSLVSVTVLSEDGDAQRFVDCHDLNIRRADCVRALGHRLNLPVTSGYYDCFSAGGKNVAQSQNDVPVKEYGASLQPTLQFESVLSGMTSYKYSWWTINSFAMDQRQYRHMYRSDDSAQSVEFTHLVLEDPTEELLVVVQFPRGFRPNGIPRIRITRASEVDPLVWVRESDIEKDLNSSHALLYVESISTAAFRIRYPQVGLSYGIEWNVPKISDNSLQQGVQKFVRHLANAELRDQVILSALEDVIVSARKNFLRTWSDSLHCSLMLFDYDEGTLRLKCAAEEKGKNRVTIRPYQGFLKYGDGIAGRAFKGNRLTGYVAPDTSETDRPDYYRRLTGGASHKAMISLPLCIPEKDFLRDNKIYKSKEPYGVINLGSDSTQCPLSELKIAENMPRLLFFQHYVNKRMYRTLFPVAVTETKRRA